MSDVNAEESLNILISGGGPKLRSEYKCKTTCTLQGSDVQNDVMHVNDVRSTIPLHQTEESTYSETSMEL